MTGVPRGLASALAYRYRLERELGQGGMATVYLAQDLKHDRLVAIKVLRPDLAAVIGGERFLSEIKTTANLQHPHILPLFDSGECDGLLYYVMPFVEGETLRDRLLRERQLPIPEALRIAGEVADALDYAHRKGIVHRDIKPENVLLHEGRALVSDFGIALAASKAGGSRMTETGMSIGTPHYMAPEQAMGEREIGPRADVYSLGAVTYEMLVGEPPFTGVTAQAVVARVLTEAPRPMRAQRHTIPSHVETAVMAALEKLPADRFASSAAFREALAGASIAGATPATQRFTAATPTGRWTTRLRDPVVAMLSVGLIAAVAAVVVLAVRRPPATSSRAIRFLFFGNDSAPVVASGPWPAAISPDGGTVVYQVPSRGTAMLYARRTDELDGHPLSGTESAAQPLFSPDGRWLAFEAQNKEKKMRLDGSAPVVIAEGGYNNGADWTTRDELLVGSTGEKRGLSRVSVAGGELRQFTWPDTTHGVLDHLWPIATLDGRNAVFVIWRGALPSAELALVSLGDGTVTPLGLKGIRPLAVLDGQLVYVRADGAVMATSLDVSGRRVGAHPIPVHDPVEVDPALNGNSGIFLSKGGALVTTRPSYLATLSWVARDGSSQPIVPGKQAFFVPRLSPDGQRIAVVIARDGKTDVWLVDLRTSTLSQLTSNGTTVWVEWAPDGTQVVYAAAGPEGRTAVWEQRVDASAAPQRLFDIPLLGAVDMAPDGRSVLVSSVRTNQWELVRVALDSARTTTVYSATRGAEIHPNISPDNHWALFSSNASGVHEIYVASYPDPTAKVQVSVGGGLGGMWSRDGATVYYYSNGVLMAAHLATGGGLHVVSRDTAFRRVTSAVFGPNYDVAPDGARIVVPLPADTRFPLVIVPNWRTEFRDRLEAARP